MNRSCVFAVLLVAVGCGGDGFSAIGPPVTSVVLAPPSFSTAEDWGPGPGGAGLTYVARKAAGSSYVSWRLDIPQGSTLLGMSLPVTGSPADVALPGVFPAMELVEHDSVTGTTEWPTGLASDVQPDLASYQARHTFGVVLSHPIDNSRTSYVLLFMGEMGAGAEPGLTVEQPVLTYSPVQ